MRRTALHWACQMAVQSLALGMPNGHARVVELLVDCGANTKVVGLCWISCIL